MQDLNDFGKIEFVHNKRARRIIIRINTKGLRITLPTNSRKTDAIQHILKNKKNILKRQKALQIKQNEFNINFDKEIQTLTFIIRFTASKRENVFFQLKNDILNVEIPYDADINSD